MTAPHGLRLGAGGINALQQFILLTAAPVTLLVLPTLLTGPLAARRLYAAQRLRR
jgi:glycine betaine transporter